MTATQHHPDRYYVVFMTTIFGSLAQAQQTAPTQLAAHLERSRKLHTEGALLMAGAFLDQPEQPVRTMGVLATREAAEAYARHDPFVEDNMVSEWVIREWANMLT